MHIRPFKKEDLLKIHNLLLSNTWEFFTKPTLSKSDLISRNEYYFSSISNETIVLVDDEEDVKGFIRFFDIENVEDASTLFDVYVDLGYRGKGFGTLLVIEGIKYIYEKYKNIRRIEATTRFDNLTMQKVLEKCGFRKEAQYRKAWKIDSESFVDTFGYGLLREEFLK